MGNNKHDFSGKKNPNYKTGLKVAGVTSSLYNSWCGMKQRCLNPNNPKYKNYGGRGINIFKEWLDIRGFHKWALESGWKQGMSIDRIDNNGDYCPENCRWISQSENSRKKSTTKITIEQANEIKEALYNGKSRKELAQKYNVSLGTIWFIDKNITHTKEGNCTKKLKEMKNKV